ncbi:hypothetical protein LB553_20975 [Mesorhizobium sp. CA8]|nr:hypothetical protein [Mesorhizobium sp. CA8]
MIDGGPVELGAEVLFHLRHEASGQRPEVVIIDAILGRDDEPELVPIAMGAIEELRAVGAILLCAIEFARLSLARDTIALEIAQMRTRPVNTLADQLDDARLHHHPALPESSVAVT